MSLTKAIEHGKERRKEYRDDRFYSVRSRNHNAYAWSYLSVKYKAKKRAMKGADFHADAFDFAPNQFREIPVVSGRHMQQTPDTPDVEADMEAARTTRNERG